MDSFFFQSQTTATSQLNHQYARREKLKESTPLAAIDSCVCYGVLHEPEGHFMADHAVLFLYPWGQEYGRSHRALRKLAIQLAQKGIPSLRFDYRGTGDSGGSDHDFDLQHAQDDIRSALAMLQEFTGVRQVKVCAIRIGCLLGLQSLAKEPAVTEFHCWDPLLDGQQYLDELMGASITSRIEDGDTTWINGFPLTARLKNGLATAKVAADACRTSMFIYGAEQNPSFETWVANRRAAQCPVTISHGFENGRRVEWGTVDMVGGFVSPTVILDAIEKGLVAGYEF